MRGVQLSLNKTQRLRLETAFKKLESLSSNTNNNSNASVIVVDTIQSIKQEFSSNIGHGTSEMDGQVAANVCERVNTLVYVRALRTRYKLEIGGIIVSHVIEFHRGQLLRIPPYLVKRRKQHFHRLELYGVDLILGCNGFIWAGEHVEAKYDMAVDHTSLEIRQHICRIANTVKVLSTLRFMVTEIVDLSSLHNLHIHEMLGAEFYVIVAENEAED